MSRPVMTKEKIKELEECFLKGLSDKEACLEVNIAYDTFYAYLRKHPKFAERRELLKSNTSIMAKKNVHHKLEEGDIKTSKWYLERKCPEEFGKNVTINSNINTDLTEEIDAITKAIREGYGKAKETS